MLRKCFSILTLCVAHTMTENIQHSIQEIRTKALRFKDELIAVNAKNALLEQEVTTAKDRIEECNAELEKLNSENSSLKSELEALKSQVVNVTPTFTRNEEEIDELVKEIEYCIGQLKK